MEQQVWVLMGYAGSDFYGVEGVYDSLAAVMAANPDADWAPDFTGEVWSNWRDAPHRMECWPMVVQALPALTLLVDDEGVS